MYLRQLRRNCFRMADCNERGRGAATRGAEERRRVAKTWRGGVERETGGDKSAAQRGARAGCYLNSVIRKILFKKYSVSQ